MSYVIPDEPTPTALNKYAVRPNAILLATMLCGAWLAWPWYAFNAFAIGSPTRRRELAMCLAALFGTAILVEILLALMDFGVIVSPTALRIFALGIAAFKMGMAYWVSLVQQRTFSVYEYYGGRIRSAAAVITIGMYLRPIIMGLVDDPIWRIIISGGV